MGPTLVSKQTSTRRWLGYGGREGADLHPPRWVLTRRLWGVFVWACVPGDLFIQMAVRYGQNSQLCRVVSEAVAHPPEGQDQAVQSYLQGLPPRDREALEALIKAAREDYCPPLTLDLLDSPAKDRRDHRVRPEEEEEEVADLSNFRVRGQSVILRDPCFGLRFVSNFLTIRQTNLLTFQLDEVSRHLWV